MNGVLALDAKSHPLLRQKKKYYKIFKEGEDRLKEIAK